MKNIVMVGTGFNTMGGIASVINVYRTAGLFQRFPIDYIVTHCDGGALVKLSTMFRAYLHFLGLIVMRRVGLVHVHVASRTSFWRKSFFFLLAFFFRIPTILHLHGAEFAIFFDKECGSLRRRFISYVFNNVTRVVVLSGEWKTWVATISRNPHIDAIYNPVLLPPAPSEWGERERGAVLFLGRLGKRKGSYDLLDAAAITVAAQPNLRLMLGGDGELEQVKARAGQLGIGSHIDLLGWVKTGAKEHYLSRASIYVLPSYNEGLPMSVLEAMAAGLPIVSTPIGGIPEAITDGEEGFLVAAGDVEALAARLSQLLGNDALAQRMGMAARRKVETTFSSDVVLPRVEQMYLDLGIARL